MGLATTGAATLPAFISCKPKKDEKVVVTQDKDTSKREVLKKYSPKAKKLVNEATCIDMLGTYGDWFTQRGGMSLEQCWSTKPNSFTEEDYKFVTSCGINIFGWGNMVPTFEGMLEFMALQNGIIASNPDYFERIDTKEKLKNINTSNKIGMLITNQESSQFRTVYDVDLFYHLGLRVSQITYNGENRLGCGAFVDTDTGLTDYGREIIKRMNEIGMAIDVSHCGDKTTMGAIEASTKPVLVTHGACRAIAKGVARAKTDEAIKAIAKTGGVVGIPILRFMIREKEPVNFNHFLDHIDHVVQITGIEHVGIGSDQGLYTEDYGNKAWRKNRLDNAPAKYQVHTNEDYLLTIEGLNHPYRTYDIAEGLIKRGYKDDHIKMVLGDNFKRVLGKIFNH
ncbi:dipeptidase [Flagellimonas onchidii]|uniref:dipeptidase n=1 Tax=Flagellimonas onchidii TaxID=2562684 RepID=UPI0014561D87|nr:membrane dipeptidase [Allomuricauda onchidii]